MWRSTIILLVLMLGLQLDAIAIQQQEPNDPTNDMEEEPQQNWDEFDNIEE